MTPLQDVSSINSYDPVKRKRPRHSCFLSIHWFSLLHTVVALVLVTHKTHVFVIGTSSFEERARERERESICCLEMWPKLTWTMFTFRFCSEDSPVGPAAICLPAASTSAASSDSGTSSPPESSPRNGRQGSKERACANNFPIC